VFTNHLVGDKEKVEAAFKKAGISITPGKTIIFTGGVPAFVLSAVVNHYYEQKAKVFELDVAAWEEWHGKNPSPVAPIDKGIEKNVSQSATNNNSNETVAKKE